MVFNYEWVQLHQDRYKLWQQLPLKQQLNCICDLLVKSAVQYSPHCLEPWLRKQTLPCRNSVIFIASLKQTTDVAKDVRFTLGYKDADTFYNKSCG